MTYCGPVLTSPAAPHLQDNGVSICIYANHMLRAAYPSMLSVAESILTNARSFEADGDVLPVKSIITLIDDNTGMGSKAKGDGKRGFATSARQQPHGTGT